MADIELLIKIPEGLKNDFESEQWTALSCIEMKNALEKATPLPKGHGRIVDIGPYEGKVIATRKYFGVDKLVEVAELDTIIEADKEHKDGQNTIKD